LHFITKFIKIYQLFKTILAVARGNSWKDGRGGSGVASWERINTLFTLIKNAFLSRNLD